MPCARESAKENPLHENLQQIRQEFILWAGRVFGGGSTLPSFLGKDAYTTFFPALSRAYPAIFPARSCRLLDWRWASEVVMMCGVPLHPYGAALDGLGAPPAPLQCCLPPLFPLFPSLKGGGGSGGGLGAKWATQPAAACEGGWSACLLACGNMGRKGAKIYGNPATPCLVSVAKEGEVSSKGLLSHCFPLPVPIQLTWLLSPEEEEGEEEEEQQQ